MNILKASFAFHIETSHLICSENQMTVFYMKCNAVLKWLMLAVNVMKECMKFVQMQEEMHQMDFCNFFWM